MGIIKRPALTEKSQAMQEKGKYVFVVDNDANKIEIAKEVKKMYGVNVTDVATLRQIGKKKSRSTRTKITTGRTSTFKKAIVTVAAGEVIDFYQGI
ncbi:50S ribosomal protein L23 [Sandaracinomonas limnophila]|jgi:large subunit ribosomal protein L23|uniref:Large ribosomal subunit protein uL23 n=1 Tax=Sandaracinomonas limnophila TaxID=1862386 RepID=A0A437PUG3_9BACT|nr:50S ribosomal protein L23 [Sandaracinomonas limnophila]RVU25870.1 50S ribosomal protein L23 [Sandaracinomonas limnophila]